LCVLHSENLSAFGPAVVGERPHVALAVPPDELWLGPGMLWRMLILSGRLEWGYILFGGVRGMARRLAGRLYRLYYLALLAHIAPKVVLTFVDDSVLFQWLWRAFPEATFMAVQNGTRAATGFEAFIAGLRDPEPRRIHLPIFFCHSQRDVELFTQAGADVREYVPVGSVRSMGLPPRGSVTTRHCICLVSQWHHHMEIGEAYPDLWHGMVRLDEYLARYQRETGTAVVVALRSHDPREAAYFRRVYGEDVEMVAFEPGVSTYRTMAASEVVLGMNSTAVMEAFGWGAKICYVNLTGRQCNSLVEPGPWLLEECSYDEFRRHMETLLSMPPAQWRELAEAYGRHCMAGQDIPAHLAIQARLDAALA
jgi:surface carbohydrate biosynthesis protein